MGDIDIGNANSIAAFSAAREALIKKEKQQRSDHVFRSELSEVARQACDIVSRIRDSERSAIWTTTKNAELQENEMFPGMMFNVAKASMESTELWRIVRRMPKGTVLHCHIAAMVDLEWLFNETIETPGMVISSSSPLISADIREFATLKIVHKRSWNVQTATIWSAEYPADTFVGLKQAAESYPDGGRKGFIAWMKDRCSITQTESLQHHLGVDDVWRKLGATFSIVGPIVYYEPILRAYMEKMFLTLVEDAVKWIEVRAVLASPFVLEGDDNACEDILKVVGVLDDITKKFKASDEGREFWGMRIIWTSMRHTDTAGIITDMKQCIQAKKAYPHLIAGYDVVGPEDNGRSLESLTPEIIWFQEACAAENLNIPFFFHAGECLGDGDTTDENLFSAILFGSRRLGHAFSLYKHPLLIDMVKEKQILVESCPISNEVLRYTASILSHPLPALLSRGVKAALSNDDPALLGQGTSGLTHDFWQALQGWNNLGLAGLGSLAQNSVRWAVFEDETETEWLESIEKAAAGNGIRAQRIKQWNEEWEAFCAWIVAEFK